MSLAVCGVTSTTCAWLVPGRHVPGMSSSEDSSRCPTETVITVLESLNHLPIFVTTLQTLTGYTSVKRTPKNSPLLAETPVSHLCLQGDVRVGDFRRDGLVVLEEFLEKRIVVHRQRFPTRKGSWTKGSTDVTYRSLSTALTHHVTHLSCEMDTSRLDRGRG